MPQWPVPPKRAEGKPLPCIPAGESRSDVQCKQGALTKGDEHAALHMEAGRDRL